MSISDVAADWNQLTNGMVLDHETGVLTRMTLRKLAEIKRLAKKALKTNLAKRNRPRTGKELRMLFATILTLTWDVLSYQNNLTSRETGDEKENQNDATNGPAEEQPKLMTLDEWKALQVSVGLNLIWTHVCTYASLYIRIDMNRD